MFSVSNKAGKFIHGKRKRIQQIGVPVVTVLLIVGMMLMLSPKNGLKAQNYNKVWTSTADFNAGTNSNIDTASNQAQLATSTTSFNEGFTGTTYKDAATDANWDTTAHALTLAGDPSSGTVSSLESKWKAAIGVSEAVQNMTYDSTNHIIYIGGASGSFGAYNPATDVSYNLTSKISSDWSTAAITALGFDSINGKVYIGSSAGKFGAFAGGATPANGTFTYLNSKITSDFSTNNITSIVFDTTNRIVYIGGANSKFGAYIGGSDPANGTWANASAKMNWGINYVAGMAFDSTNGKVYATGETGRFGCFTGSSDPANGTFTSLDAKYQAAYAYAIGRSLAFDSANGTIYIGSASGKFGSFTGGSNPSAVSVVDLTAKISTDFGANDMTHMIFDTTLNKIYLSTTGGKVGNYAGGATPANGTWTNLTYSSLVSPLVGYTISASAYDSTNGFIYLGGLNGQLMSYKLSDGSITSLTSKISSDWSTNQIQAMTFDSVNGVVYLGSANGKFAAFAGGATPSAGTYTSLTSKISGTWGGNQVQAMSFDATNGIVYISGQTGTFGSFVGGATPSTGTFTSLGAKLTDWTADGVTALTYDLAHGILYLGGRYGHFGAFVGGATPSTGTYTSLASKISGDWGSTHFSCLTFDSTNGIVYLGGASARFGAFNGGATPSAGTWTYLNSKITANFSTDTIQTMVFAGGKVFLGSSAGKFGVVTALTTPSSDVWTYLTASISAISGANSLNTLVATSSTNIYLGSATGYFTFFLVGYISDKNGLSTKLNSTTQTIFKATLTATVSTPTGTAITYFLSNDGGSHWNTVTSGAEYAFNTATSDLRWKANLTTTDPAVTPSITGIAISYKYFTSNTATMSLVYDATSAVTPTLLSWNDTLPTNTAMTVKIRSAATQVGLAAATWSDSKNAADTPVNLKTINVGGVTGVPENQFSEVYITLTTSDGLASPVLSDITEQYVINQAPQIQSLTASQATDGTKTVNIAYQLKDPDTSSNPYNQNQVAATFQYSIDSGSNWSNCSTITNSGLQTVNSDGSWTSKTAVWTAGTDLANSYYNGTVKIRVNANDNEQAHNTASLDSSAFSLDTKNPVPAAVTGGVGINVNNGASWTNSATVTLSLLASDDGAKYMEIRNDNSFVNSQEAYALSKSNYSLSAGDGNKTVYVRFYDAFGNYTDASYNILLDTTSPDVPQHFTVFDTSDQSAGTFSSVVVWNPINNPGDFSQYVIERSIDGGSNWSQLATFTNISTNAYSDMGLSNAVTYVYRMRSLDTHTNYSAYSDTKSLKPAGADTVPPTITGTGPTPEAADKTATISWTTDKPSDSYVEYGTTTNYGSIQGTDDLVVNHTVHLVGLNPTTTYQFRVKCRDAAGNRVVSANQSFTTTLPAEAAAGVSITGATAQKPGADPEEVTIIWTTDKYSTSQVLYGTDSASLDMSTTEDTTLNKTHYISIAHLNPNTKYYYQAKSIDTYGNTVLGELKYFVTAQSGLSSPTMKSVAVSDLTMTSAIISWETTTVATSIVEFGIGDSYSDRVEDQSSGATTQHVVRLPNLTQGTGYHFRVLGQGSDQRYVASDDYKFATISLPEISAVNVSEISSTGAKVAFKTNVPTDANIDFGSENSNLSQGSGTITTDHEVSLFALKPATKYTYTIRVRDNFGNSVTSGSQSFQTIIDTTPPKIKDMKSEVSIVTDQDGNSKAQVIVSWSTDEPATGQVKYALGVAAADDYPLSTVEDKNLTTSHIVIIANLSTSATYHMKLISKDSSNNLAVSDDYSVITLNQQKTLLEYIVQILQNRFSWLSNLGFLQ